MKIRTQHTSPRKDRDSAPSVLCGSTIMVQSERSAVPHIDLHTRYHALMNYVWAHWRRTCIIIPHSLIQSHTDIHNKMGQDTGATFSIMRSYLRGHRTEHIRTYTFSYTRDMFIGTSECTYGGKGAAQWIISVTMTRV